MYDPPDTYTQAAAQYQEYYYHPPSGIILPYLPGTTYPSCSSS